jgi:hypothetical protein
MTLCSCRTRHAKVMCPRSADALAKATASVTLDYERVMTHCEFMSLTVVILQM